MASQGKVSRALISVTDKTGVVEFARALKEEFGVEIISTGGTAKALVDGGVPVTPIEEYTVAIPSSTWPRLPSMASA